MATSRQTIDHLNSFIVERVGFMLKGSKSNSQSHFGNKSLFGWLGFLLSFGKDFNDEVVTKQLTAVVDFTCMPDNNLEISK